MEIHFNDTTAAEAIASGKPVVIDIYAPWCGPCKMLAPHVEKLAEKYADKSVIGKLDSDENAEIPGQYRVRNVPTVLFFKDGEFKERIVGYVNYDELEAKLQNIL